MLSERPANNGADAESARTRRILVVDDEAPIRELLNAVLSVEGYGVTTTEDGKQAIGLLERDRFDLIISDVRMPGLDGIAVLRAAKRIDPHCPVIMMTGYHDEGAETSLVSLGAADCVTNPFNLDSFARRVAELLETNRARGR